MKYIIHATITREGEPEPDLILTRRFTSEEPTLQVLQVEAEKLCKELREPKTVYTRV